MVSRISEILVLSPFLPPDQDDWVGQFFGGREYPLLWKEGEVYLLPLTEEDIGFYKAPGESGGKKDPGSPLMTGCFRLFPRKQFCIIGINAIG